MGRAAVTTPKIAPAAGPFSPAVAGSASLYLSGQVAQDPETGRLIEGDTPAQTDRILRNVMAVLEAANKSPADVLRVGVFLTDMEDFQAMNAVYATYFEPPYPARTTVGVAALPLGARVEMDFVAR
jgi:2-iminobutanoate/2-iminopropanoate deaminase